MNEAPQESATETSVENTSASTVPPTEAVADTTTRPEWLPEKFQTPEDLAKSYSELSTKIGQKEEEIEKKLEEEAFSQRPASAGDYQIPEVLSEEEAATNPLLKEWAEYAWENGYSQEEFSHWVNKFAEYQEAQQPDLNQIKQELGDNANQRVESAQLFLQKFFPTEMQDAIAQLGTSAEGIKAVEYIQKQMQSTTISNQATVPAGLTQEDVEARMRDPRYYDPARRDRGFVDQVNNDFQKLYG
jgi:uncharacterized membrane protein YheB (UPF0754 family)